MSQAESLSPDTSPTPRTDGGKWSENVESKLAKMGFESKWVHRFPKHYSCVGKGTSTIGLKRFPFALKLTTGSVIPGTLDSHEMPGSSIFAYQPEEPNNSWTRQEHEEFDSFVFGQTRDPSIGQGPRLRFTHG